MAKRILTGMVGIIIIAAIAYTGASWFVGQRAEALIHNRVAAYNQQLDYYLPTEVQATLTIDDYQRHVFSSDVQYTLAITSGGDTQKIRFAGHLVHGPLPFSEVRRGNIQPLMVASYMRLLPTDSSQAMFAARSDKTVSPVTVHTTLTFQGSGQSIWHFQPLASEQGNATFSGGTATLTLANNFQDSTLNAEFGGFSIDEDDVSLRLQGIGISGETSVADSGATASAVAISIAAMESQTRLGLKQKATDTRLAFSGTLAQGLVDGKLQYSVGHTQSGQLDLGELELSAHVENVNVEGVRALQQLLAARAEGGSSQPQQLSLQAVVNKVLAPQPVLAIDEFRWQTPVGTSAMTLNLHFTQPENAMGQPLPMMLADAVQRGELKLSVSRPMLAQVLQQSLVNAGMDAALSDMRANMIIAASVNKLERTGLFEISDDVVKTAISYQDQKFTVNGEKMSIGVFMGHLFALAMTLG